MTISFQSDPSDTLVYDIIERVAQVLGTIPNLDGSGDMVDVSDVFWDPSNQFPRFYIKFAGAQLDDGSINGQPMYTDVLSFTIRLIVGSLNSGYLMQPEHNVNRYVMQVIRRFRHIPMLNDLTTGAALRYETKPGAQLSLVPNGSRGIKFDENGPLFMCVDFQLDVKVTTQSGRVT